MNAAPRSFTLRVVDGLAIAAIAVLGVMALEPDQLSMMFRTSWAGFPETAAVTVVAALRVWTFWSAAAAVIAGWLYRADPTLGRLDAVLGGLAGVWIFAYVGGNLLGPIGLFRWWAVWALVLLGASSLWRDPPRWSAPTPTFGQQLALVIVALAVPTALILQLGCPAPAYMDIFATPAAAQRLMTFGWYHPYDNDPYGYWDAGSSLPGLELFYGLLGFASGTSLGLLADTAAIAPMVTLMILATYRFGRTLGGDVMGGYASVLLVATILPRVLPFGHGRSTAFVMLTLGLAWVLDERRNVLRLTLGALALATGVASHAAVGAVGMAIAGLTMLGWGLGGNLRAFLAAIGMMVGAVLVAFPTVAVNRRLVLPYPVLPLAQLVGVAVTVTAARWLRQLTIVDRAWWIEWVVVAAVAYAVLTHPQGTFTNNHHQRFPLLIWGGGVGFVWSLWPSLRALLPGGRPRSRERRVALLPPACGLVVAMAVEYFYSVYPWQQLFTEPTVQVMIMSLYWKVDYWIPFILVFPTAYLATWLHRRVAARPTVWLVVFLVVFPWREKWLYPQPGTADPNYHQHGLAEAWAYQLENGKSGYWGGTRDRRWAQSPAELEAAEILRQEIAAGRITMDTHIPHLGPLQYLYKDNFLFSVYTGINDDGYITNYQFDWSIAGGRLRPIDQWPARLATKPPYIAIHSRDDPSQADNIDPFPFAGDLSEYEELFNREGVRLYRRKGLGG